MKSYLVGLGLDHLIEPIDELGVDSLEDFGFLYREDLMEAGASKEEAEAILGCTNAELEGRPDGPAQARAGYQRPSRPIAPARPAAAARLVRAPDRATLIGENHPRPDAQVDASGSGAAQGRPDAQVDASGSGAAQGRPGAQVDASGSGAAQGRPDAQVDASGSGAAQGRPDVQVSASSPGIAQGRMIDQFVASGVKDVRSDAVCQAEAQGQAHIGNASADPLGQYVPGGEAETFLTLGMPLGSQGVSSLQCERVEASSSDDSAMAVGRADMRKLHAQGDTPGGLIASEGAVVPPIPYP